MRWDSDAKIFGHIKKLRHYSFPIHTSRIKFNVVQPSLVLCSFLSQHNFFFHLELFCGCDPWKYSSYWLGALEVTMLTTVIIITAACPYALPCPDVFFRILLQFQCATPC